jgi:hypothetical protein
MQRRSGGVIHFGSDEEMIYELFRPMLIHMKATM